MKLKRFDKIYSTLKKDLIRYLNLPKDSYPQLPISHIYENNNQIWLWWINIFDTTIKIDNNDIALDFFNENENSGAKNAGGWTNIIINGDINIIYELGIFKQERKYTHDPILNSNKIRLVFRRYDKFVEFLGCYYETEPTVLDRQQKLYRIGWKWDGKEEYEI